MVNLLNDESKKSYRMFQPFKRKEFHLIEMKHLLGKGGMGRYYDVKADR